MIDMKSHIIYIISACALLLSACGGTQEVTVPENASPANAEAQIYPDYRDIVVPVNIAPLNFQVISLGHDEFVAQVKGPKGELLAGAEEDGKFFFEEKDWHKLLSENKGQNLTVTIYEKRDGGWVKYNDYTISVAEEEIDPYLSYRLIEPSYELYRQLGLYQRNLTNFEEVAIYENNRTYDNDNNHCVNCHNYQNYSAKNMMFHVRAEHGGTVFVRDGKIDKRIMTNDAILGNAVYPSWHPTKPWLVFSSNLTGQAFYLRDPQKIEVVDYGSDLIFYDAENNTVSNVLKTNDTMENFPCWAPDGKRVYYCSCYVPIMDSIAARTALEMGSLRGNKAAEDSLLNMDKGKRTDYVLGNYDKVRYNLMSIAFDEQTRTWGEPQMEVDCSADSLSVSVPRVSPDGRYVLFTLGAYGQFHIWHKTSDLYVKDLQTQEVRPLSMANSDDVDSYHTWSSNGRWIVFSSRRDDGSFTRPYIAYFDKNGADHKAFLLPQEDPEHNLLRMKSYNVPELTRDAVTTTPEQLREVIYADDKAQRVGYKK